MKELFRILETVVAHTNDAILVVEITSIDPLAAHILHLNEAFSQLTGYSAEEVLDHTPHILQETDPTVLVEIQAALRDERSMVIELAGYHKAGAKYWVELKLVPVSLKKGQATNHWILIQRDITAYKQAEEARAKLGEQLELAQKLQAIGALTGGVAHEFNNLLTVILGHAELALQTLPADDQAKNDIHSIQKSAKHATKLTRQLLAFARQQVFEPKIVNPNDLILDIGKMLRHFIGEDIELITKLALDVGRIKIDPSQFEQIILNLAINARDAMPSGGELSIETANMTLDRNQARRYSDITAGEYILISISDNGHGMSEDVKVRLFEPFFTTKDIGKGTGLGLATCYNIVKQQKGHIQVNSELGHGTTFKIFLPRVETATSPLPATAQSAQLPQGTETVLLVEDELAVRDLAARILRQQGYKVLEAQNGQEALDLAQNQSGLNIQLLLTDVVMPQMGGNSLVDQLKIVKPDLKTLLISGYSSDAITDHHLLQQGAFLQKPFSPRLLAFKVREVLDKHSKVL